MYTFDFVVAAGRNRANREDEGYSDRAYIAVHIYFLYMPSAVAMTERGSRASATFYEWWAERDLREKRTTKCKITFKKATTRSGGGSSHTIYTSREQYIQNNKCALRSPLTSHIYTSCFEAIYIIRVGRRRIRLRIYQYIHSHPRLFGRIYARLFCVCTNACKYFFARCHTQTRAIHTHEFKALLASFAV